MTIHTTSDVPKEIREACREAGEVLQFAPGKTWVAGGLLRDTVAGQPVNDIDVFAVDPSVAFNGLIRELGPVSFENPSFWAWVLPSGKTLQLIKPSFSSPEGCIEGFDFTMAQIAYDGARLLQSDAFSRDLMKRKLVFTGYTSNGAGTLRRVIKFVARGYSIDEDNFKKVLDAANAQPIAEVRAPSGGTSLVRHGGSYR